MKQKNSFEKEIFDFTTPKWVEDLEKNKILFGHKITATTIAVIFVLGIGFFASLPTIINYFSAQPSEAFSSTNPNLPPSDGGTPIPWDKAPWGNGPSDLWDFTITMSLTSATVKASDEAHFAIIATRIGGYMGDIYLNFKPLYWTWIESAVFSDDVLSFNEDSSLLTITMKSYVETSTVPFYVVAEGDGVLGNYKYAHGILDVIGDTSCSWLDGGEESMLVLPKTSGPVRIYENKIVYFVPIEDIGDGSNVFMIDKNTGAIQQITYGSDYDQWPDIYNNKIVYTKMGSWPDNVTDIYMYDIQTGESVNISNNLIGNEGFNVDSRIATIYENKIVWKNNVRNLNTGETYQEVILYNLDTGEEEVISTFGTEINYFAGREVDVYENIIVWSDQRDTQHEFKVYMYDINTGIETMISNKNGIRPVVDGSFVSWEPRLPVNDGLQIYNIQTGEYSSINDHGTEIQIRNGVMVWSDYKWVGGEVDYNIFAHRLSDPIGINCQVTYDEENQGGSDIYNSTIVWSDARDNGWPDTGIYMFEF